MKHLSPEQLSALDAYWKNWHDAAATLRGRRIRTRLYLIYLLIRFGALRLGEVVEVDDNRDISFGTLSVSIGGERSVQMQEGTMEVIRSLVEDASVADIHGSITHIDPGYIRKNFYAAAQQCSIPGDLAGPRVLRHSRGSELLAHGVPVDIVQKYLGLKSPIQAVQLRDFKTGEEMEILNAHLRRETLRHTSARNAFVGTVTAITETVSMAEVRLTMPSGLVVTALIDMEGFRTLDLRIGQTAGATIKAPCLTLAPAGSLTSDANVFPATVEKIRRGQLETSVRIRLADGTGMAALTGTAGIDRLQLAPDAPCVVSFSAMAVMMEPG